MRWNVLTQWKMIAQTPTITKILLIVTVQLLLIRTSECLDFLYVIFLCSSEGFETKKITAKHWYANSTDFLQYCYLFWFTFHRLIIWWNIYMNNTIKFLYILLFILWIFFLKCCKKQQFIIFIDKCIDFIKTFFMHMPIK